MLFASIHGTNAPCLMQMKSFATKISHWFYNLAAGFFIALVCSETFFYFITKHATMNTARAFLAIFILCSLVLSASNVVAQSPSASVSLDCEEVMRISVSPGSGTTESVTCVVENPTVYEEKISITVDAGNLTYSAPGSVVVQGGSSESFELVIVAQERMSAGSHTVNVEVSVQEIAGVPPANVAKDDSNIVVEILRYGDCSVSSTSSLVEAGLSQDSELKFRVSNLGNSADSIELSLSTSSRMNLEGAGYTVIISNPSVDLGEQNSIDVYVTVISPAQSTSSAKREGSRMIDLHTLDLVVTSKYSCDSSTGCVSDSSSVTLKLVSDVGESADNFQEDASAEASGFQGDQYLIFGSGMLSGVLILYLGYALLKKS